MTSFDATQKIADAVLYEGYLLYPYRLSSVKNRQRWNFGVLFPPAYCQRVSGAETSLMQTECLVEGTDQTRVQAKVRFLQFGSESVAPNEVGTGEWPLGALAQQTRPIPFSNQGLSALIEIGAAFVDARTFKLTVRITNQTDFQGEDRDQALRYALISTHTLLGVQEGSFHSLIDPPPSLQSARERCRNLGAWPVLAGDRERRDQMLSAPIILYDYPEVAPESPTDLFDNTEIDEILSLRIRTLTEQEKLEIRQGDDRGRQLIDRVEALHAGEWVNLHGKLRPGSGSSQRLVLGDRVRLKPKRRADILDLALAGRTARVCALEQDIEGNSYVCVTVDDDPGRDLGADAQPGHRFFFALDEVEKI